MQSIVSRRGMAVIGAACAMASLGLSNAAQASTKSCNPVVNPYAGTRYEGANLSQIRATGVSCRIARQVARGAHQKALGTPLPADGVRRITWHGWAVRGDVRGESDSYVATSGAKRVSWRF